MRGGGGQGNEAVVRSAGGVELPQGERLDQRARLLWRAGGQEGMRIQRQSWAIMQRPGGREGIRIEFAFKGNPAAGGRPGGDADSAAILQRAGGWKSRRRLQPECESSGKPFALGNRMANFMAKSMFKFAGKMAPDGWC